MGKTYVSNDTDQAKFVGGKLLQPGEGREFDDQDVPGEHRPGAEAGAVEPVLDPAGPTRADEVLAFYTGANAAALIAAVPEYSLEDLALIEAFELERKQPRSTVLAAVTNQRIERANAGIDAAHARGAAEAAVAIAQTAVDASPEDAALVQALADAKAQLADLTVPTGA
jgi:hypothetical protein